MLPGRSSATTVFGDFEWDPVKEARNIRDRDLDFATASEIWRGGVIEKIDDRRDYGETRILAFGNVNERLVAVCLPGEAHDAESYRRERPTDVNKDASRQNSSLHAERHKMDWARFDAITDAEIEASVRDDPDAPPIVDEDWFAGATLVMPKAKEQISIRLDADILAHFRQYPRYQTRINAILRAAMEHEKKKAG
jgi:uncharacterized protein (DUF4415 family)/uncharacterized DUF497 family protein